eukprot:jgi/Chlat1/7339/Chrsp59S00542
MNSEHLAAEPGSRGSEDGHCNGFSGSGLAAELAGSIADKAHPSTVAQSQAVLQQLALDVERCCGLPDSTTCMQPHDVEGSASSEALVSRNTEASLAYVPHLHIEGMAQDELQTLAAFTQPPDLDYAAVVVTYIRRPGDDDPAAPRNHKKRSANCVGPGRPSKKGKAAFLPMAVPKGMRLKQLARKAIPPSEPQLAEPSSLAHTSGTNQDAHLALKALDMDQLPAGWRIDYHTQKGGNRVKRYIGPTGVKLYTIPQIRHYFKQQAAKAGPLSPPASSKTGSQQRRAGVAVRHEATLHAHISQQHRKQTRRRTASKQIHQQLTVAEYDKARQKSSALIIPLPGNWFVIKYECQGRPRRRFVSPEGRSFPSRAEAYRFIHGVDFSD